MPILSHRLATEKSPKLEAFERTKESIYNNVKTSPTSIKLNEKRVDFLLKAKLKREQINSQRKQGISVKNEMVGRTKSTDLGFKTQTVFGNPYG